MPLGGAFQAIKKPFTPEGMKGKIKIYVSGLSQLVYTLSQF